MRKRLRDDIHKGASSIGRLHMCVRSEHTIPARIPRVRQMRESMMRDRLAAAKGMNRRVTISPQVQLASR
jgi:hypothetical protein